MSDQSFKKELLQDAQKRTSKLTKTASQQGPEDTFIRVLTAEGTFRLKKIKTASLEKEAMAAHSTKELKNSVSNTVWTIPNKTRRIKQIEAELEQAFAPYAKHLLARLKNFQRQPGDIPTLSGYFAGERGIQLSDEGDNSTLRMEFEFTRQVMPTSGVGADNAKKNIELLEEIVPGFTDFVNAVNEHKVPLVPGFHTTTKALDVGRGNQIEEIKKFIQQQAAEAEDGRAFQYGESSIPYNSFWIDHLKRYKSEDRRQWPKATEQRKDNRLFEMKEAFSVGYPSYLMRAIQLKIYEGFRLDESRLERAISSNIKKIIQRSNASETSEDRKNALNYYLLTQWVKEQADKIINAYKISLGDSRSNKMTVKKFKGGKWQNEQVPVHSYFWGTNPTSNKPMVGLRTNAPSDKEKKTKNLYCIDLNNTELQYLLYSLTKFDQSLTQHSMLPKGHRPTPNGFLIEDFSLTYASNGFDTDPRLQLPGMIGPQMLVLPPMVKDPTGNITFNTDHGNLCRNILAGKGSTKNIIEFLSDPRVGDWARNALQTLEAPAIGPAQRGRSYGKNVQSLYDEAKGQTSSGAYEVWAKYIGTSKKRNRTSAESLQDQILFDPSSGQPRSKEELAQFLQFSWASELAKEQVRQYAKDLLATRRHVIEQFAIGPRVISLLENALVDPDNFNSDEAKQLIELLRNEPNLKRLDYEFSDQRRKNYRRKYEDMLKNFLTQGGRETQSKDYIDINDELYNLLHTYGYAVAKMMDFLHALMVRSCEERLVQKLSPEAAQQKIQKFRNEQAALGNPVDEADVPVTPQNTEIHHFSYGRTYSSTTGKNKKGTLVFGIKYAFNAPEFNPSDEEFKRIYQQARESARARGHGQGLFAPHPTAGDPAMGRATRHPQHATEREEIFQPDPLANYDETSQPRGVVRIVEDMTFWFGLKSSESDFARSLRGTTREHGFLMKVEEQYSYQDAIAALKTQYPQIEKDLDIVFSPISISVADLKRSADKAITKMKENLLANGINIDVAITDSQNQIRFASSMREIGAAAAIEEMESQTDDAAGNRQTVESPEPAQGYQYEYPQPEVPGQTGTVPQTQTATPTLPEQQMGPQPETEAIQPDAPELIDETEIDEPNDMPKPMEFIGKPNKGRSLIRNTPKPESSKLRRASDNNEVLLKLADKLDTEGHHSLADKLDTLINALGE